MAIYFKQYTVTTTATSLATVFGTTLPDPHLNAVILVAKAGNTGATYVGGSDVAATPAAAGLALNPTATLNDKVSIAPGGPTLNISADKVYIIGTANDVLFITGLA